MITGSVAANFYSVPRMTRDIDVVVEIHAGNIDKVVNLFQKDFYIDREAIEQAVRENGMFNTIHNESVIKIDFIVRKPLPYRLEEFRRRRFVRIEGTDICMVSPEDLVISKLLWIKDGISETQMKDVRNLLGSVRDMDTSYLMRWISALGLQHIYEAMKSE